MRKIREGNPVNVNTKMNTKSLVLVALFLALSFVGANITIFSSIALDSFPGFVAALLLGPLYGAAIGFLGHFFTALTSGFPLSIPIHLAIAVSMAVTMLGFGLTYKALKKKIPMAGNLVITGIVGVILNAPVSLGFSMGTLALIAGWEAALGLLAMLPILLVASAINVVLGIVSFKPLERVWDKSA